MSVIICGSLKDPHGSPPIEGKSIIVAPSFFVAKNGLVKLAKYEEKYAKDTISAQQTQIVANQNTSSNQTSVTTNSPQSPSQEELDNNKPTIILPSVFKALDRQHETFNEKEL